MIPVLKNVDLSQVRIPVAILMTRRWYVRLPEPPTVDTAMLAMSFFTNDSGYTVTGRRPQRLQPVSP
jgi:hypothetical protein